MRLLAALVLASTAYAFPAPQTANGNGTCNAELVAKLAGGIQANLNIQAQELKGVQTLQKLVSANRTGASINGSSNFQSQQQAVLVIQQQGIDIRAENQKVAAELKSPSEDGLAIVAQAQVTEMMQVKGLQGGGEADKKTLETLVKEVQDGTKQNMMNLMMAESQCKKA